MRVSSVSRPLWAKRFRLAALVYRWTSLTVSQPPHAMISWSVQPASASRVAAAFRNPCDELPLGTPASLHRSRNQLPKPAALNALPVLSCKIRQVLGGRCIECFTQARQNRDFNERARFLLTDGKDAVPNVLSAHSHYVATALRSVQQQLERKSCLGSNRVAGAVFLNIFGAPN